MSVKRDLFSDGVTAHSSLRGKADVAHFSDGTPCRVISQVANLRSKLDSGPERQILYGHKVCQLQKNNPVSRDETSGYVGYIDPANLGAWIAPTHRIAARSTFLFSAPDFKSPNPLHLSCGSLLRIVRNDGTYAETQDGQFAISNHLQDVTEPQFDLATTAEKLIGTPYLWAGNSAFGIDCSGLVQMACQAAHIPCPGDSDQQMANLGTQLAPNTTPKRNDLMFWKGHVAILFDSQTLIHANAYHMAVALEPLQDAIRRIEAQGDGQVLSHKRL